MSSEASGAGQTRDDVQNRTGSRPRWRLLAGMGWLATAGAAAVGCAALWWSDDLGERTGLRLVADYAAFMSVTFAWHAALAMVGVVGMAVLIRRRWLGLAALGVGLLCGVPEAGVALRRSEVVERQSVATTPALTLMSVNTMYSRVDGGALLREIREHGPDVIVFQEWTERGERSIRPLLEGAYPHWVSAARDDAFGQAVCSRWRFARPARLFPPGIGGREPQITVEVELAGRPVRVTNVHTLPPKSPRHFAGQRELVRGLSAWIESGAADRPHVLAGDFNAVARSATMARLRRAGMSDAHQAAARWGRGSTWPRIGVLRHVPGIRLDHVMHGPEMLCLGAQECRDIGSDHKPVVARLMWRKADRTD